MFHLNKRSSKDIRVTLEMDKCCDFFITAIKYYRVRALPYKTQHDNRRHLNGKS
jgi:hypothetical protein